MVTFAVCIAFSLVALWWLRVNLPRLGAPRILAGVALGLALPLGVVSLTAATSPGGASGPTGAAAPWVVAAAGR